MQESDVWTRLQDQRSAQRFGLCDLPRGYKGAYSIFKMICRVMQLVSPHAAYQLFFFSDKS